MTHWSGTQSGWNTRGGTCADHLRIDQQTAMENNPDSVVWEVRAQIELDNLVTILEQDDYRTYAELNRFEQRTWKEIYQAAVNFDARELDCACIPDHVCLACQARSRLSEIPF